ncbi:MAG TPA: ATP-binding protein [Verrucomicrobiae bacterium]|nr:ATP-binding protein [Verrucomicrobiae bacterium]
MPDSTDNSASRREEALLSWIQQFAPYGVVTLDESFQIRSWNHWMELHSGKRLVDVTGKNLFTLFPDLRERKLVSHFERALQGESSVLSTSLHRYLLPLPSPFRETSTPLMLQTARITPLFFEGKVCGVVLVIEDVTQRESQAEMLARQHRRDELLSWTLGQLLKTDQPRKAVRQLFFKIAEQLDFDTFLIYLRDPETGTSSLDAAGGIPVELEKDFSVCPFLAVLPGESREVITLNAISRRLEPEYSIFKKAGISAAVVIPLFAKDRDLGLLCFATGTHEWILPEESDLMKTIAQYLATALDRENTSQQLRRAKELLSEHAQLLEKRVQERTSSLQETISELETFSYTIAHDLRAPVRGITGYCEVLLEDFTNELPAEAKRIVEKIARASSRMDTLTRDLLEFSKVSRQEIALSRVELEPIVDDLATLLVPSARQTITICSPLHPVLAHKGLLQHVFSNLIDNAVKFVPAEKPPKITISAEIVPHSSPNTRSRTLIFSSTEPASQEDASSPAQPSPNHVRIWVRDEGIGIPREAHQKIFGIFERGVTSDSYQGTGIGLAIVARAMQRMGGTCGVESEPGKGSGFWLELPAA